MHAKRIIIQKYGYELIVCMLQKQSINMFFILAHAVLN
jgi:hypothetical protein